MCVGGGSAHDDDNDHSRVTRKAAPLSRPKHERPQPTRISKQIPLAGVKGLSRPPVSADPTNFPQKMGLRPQALADPHLMNSPDHPFPGQLTPVIPPAHGTKMTLVMNAPVFWALRPFRLFRFPSVSSHVVWFSSFKIRSTCFASSCVSRALQGRCTRG